MKAAIYVRVSTSKRTDDKQAFLQNPDVQEEPLRTLVSSRGWTVYRVYCDRLSGANSNRPAFRELLNDARRGCFGAVVVWRFDRLGRSVKDLINSLEQFRQANIDFISHTEAIDTGTSVGRMVFAFLAGIAEFEREMIIERTCAGMEHARSHGTKSGKPIGRPRRVFDRAEAARLRSEGWSYEKIARSMKLGRGTVIDGIQTFIAAEKGSVSGVASASAP